MAARRNLRSRLGIKTVAEIEIAIDLGVEGTRAELNIDAGKVGRLAR